MAFINVLLSHWNSYQISMMKIQQHFGSSALWHSHRDSHQDFVFKIQKKVALFSRREFGKVSHQVHHKALIGFRVCVNDVHQHVWSKAHQNTSKYYTCGACLTHNETTCHQLTQMGAITCVVYHAPNKTQICIYSMSLEYIPIIHG